MIRTERLELVPVTVELLQADLDGGAALGAALDAEVTASWPPDLYDESAIRWTIAKLTSSPPESHGFWGYYFVLRATGGRSVLVGVGGFKGPPENGRVELGYSIVAEHRRRGLAVEAVRGMLRHAFAHPAVTEVTAQTLPELTPSIGVLEKTGFRLEGDASEEGVILYVLTRPEYESGSDPH